MAQTQLRSTSSIPLRIEGTAVCTWLIWSFQRVQADGVTVCYGYTQLFRSHHYWLSSCAEFSSFAFVHPVIRHLSPEHHIRVKQGLLRTFGRVMSILMTLCVPELSREAVERRNEKAQSRILQNGEEPAAR